MNEYELLAFVDENVASKDPLKDASDLISESLRQQGATLLKLDTLGRRPLGYRIRKKNEAQLVVAHFKLKPAEVAKLKRALRLNNSVLTFMITHKTAEVGTQPQEARPIKKPFRRKPADTRQRSEYASKPE